MRGMTRSHVRGMILGGAIGDALGAPVETWDLKRITEVHGGPITKYVSPIGHKWFKPEEFLPGMTTDDTQLTVATMEGLLHGHGKATAENNFDRYMDAIAEAHVRAMKHAIGGWGKSTTEAVERIANGVHWSQSGKTEEANRGTGNGVPMKNAPLALWAVSPQGGMKWLDDDTFQFNQRLVDFSAMTHWSSLSAEASVVHANVMYYLLLDNFVPKHFVDLIFEVVWEWRDKADSNGWHTAGLNQTEHTLKDRLHRVGELWWTGKLKSMSTDDLRAEFGNGSCYVYDSLPFSYALFLRNWESFGSVMAAVNAGGDNDTNAKMVGEMLGAVHGIEFFETPELKWTLEGLHGRDGLEALVKQYCETFGVE